MIRERLLVRGVEGARVALGVEGDDAQPVRPHRRGRRRLELDAHLAKDPHGAVAQRLEQPAGGGVGLEDAVLDPACAPAGGLLLEPGRDQRPDPAPGRVGVNVPLGAPELAQLAHRPVADDAVAVAHDAHVPLEVELRPLLLQIGLREGVWPYSDDSSAATTSVTAAASAATAGGADGGLHARCTLLQGGNDIICSGIDSGGHDTPRTCWE